MCLREDTFTRDNRLCDGFNRPCMVLFSAVDVVAKQRYVKQTKFSVQREQAKSIRHVIWDTKIANNFMISGQYLQSSAVL